MSQPLQKELKESLITKYFSYGLHHKEIINILKALHGLKVSYRSLKRILARLKLYRRKFYSKPEDVINFIGSQIRKSGKLHGYRWMHLKCLQNNLVVTQENVRELLWLLDKKGMELRKRKRLRRRKYDNWGPNYLWHIDSYDKLKPYGICINGCIDGFSRYIVWLRAGFTSSNPKVIAGYYIQALKELSGCPRTIRADMGNENKGIEKMQNNFRELFDETHSRRPSFIYGKSTHNQRIEAWWSILRKQNAQFWMNLFQMLKDEHLFDGSFLDKSLIQFCFMDIIQRELNQIVFEWNLHRIRRTRNSNGFCGRPAIMFEMPQIYGSKSYLINLPSFALTAMIPNCTFLEYPCDKDIYDLCNILLMENKLIHKDDPFEGINLYCKLRILLKSIL